MRRVRLRPDALGTSTSVSPISRPTGWPALRVTVAATKQWVAPSSSGTSRHAAARDQAAQRVADERDRPAPHRPRREERLEQVGERAAVLRDVAAGVVADVDGREGEVAVQARAVRLARALGAEPPRELAFHQP